MDVLVPEAVVRLHMDHFKVDYKKVIGLENSEEHVIYMSFELSW